MENDFLKEFIKQAAKENEAKIAEEKRKKHFQELGRKGGMKKKTSQQFSKVVSVRLTEKEFEEIETLSSKYNMKISKYLRLILTEKELKIKEFQTDEVLLQYGTYFKKITNLLRNREWNVFENKKEILMKIENLIELIHQYLYSKVNQKNRNE
ncbi:plasmid mobilization protein [Epilithonimonas hominis]|uniref:plasmid mobilization protein n=1 Tax=Epilithonimonas hominis TaxID=420404 RepID=UPI000ED6FE22|nr:special sigma factor [Epilithonimonas hominis]HAP96447.1 special sigma factor [Chryseobacterium sp.]